MVRWLREDGGFSTKQCIEAFEICDRQVKRDVDYIRNSIGIGVRYLRSEKKYVPTGTLGDYDYLDGKLVTFIALTMDLAKSQGLTALISDELSSILKRTVSKDKYDEVVGRIEMKSAISDLPDRAVLPVVVDCIAREVRFSFVYRKGTKREEQCAVEPLRLINYSSRWYILAWVPDHPERPYRIFHLARISDPKATGEAWTNDCYDAVVDHLALDGWGMFIGNSGEEKTFPATILLDSDVADNIENQIWHKDQVLERLSDGQLRITVPVFDTRELMSKVLSFGVSAVPLSPPEFVSEWREKVRLMAEKAQV